MKQAGAAEDAPPGTPNPFLNNGNKKGPKQMANVIIIKGKGNKGKGGIVKPGAGGTTPPSANGSNKDDKKPKIEL